MCLFVAKNLLRLTEAELAGATLFVFDTTANFQEAIEHFRALRAACGELGVGLLVHVFQAMKFVGNVQRRKDCDLQRVDCQRAGRDFPHPAVDEFCELNNVFRIAIRPDVVGLIIDFNSDGGTTCAAFHTAFVDHSTDPGTHLSSSTISGSRAATASSMASTFMRMVSRSARSFSTWFSSRSFSLSTLPMSR